MNHHRTLVASFQVQSKSIFSTTPCLVLCLAYLRCQSACIQLKGRRIVIAFWSSSSLIVLGELQGRIVSVHALRFDISQFHDKSESTEKSQMEMAERLSDIALTSSCYATRRGRFHARTGQLAQQKRNRLAEFGLRAWYTAERPCDS